MTLERNIPSARSHWDGVSVQLNLAGKKVVVIGGGRVAFRKIKKLLKTGALVKLVAPSLTEGLEPYAKEHGIVWVAAPFVPTDLDGALLAILATDQPRVNERALAACRKAGIWVNCADNPRESDFHFSAEGNMRGLRVAVSSGGTCPGYAQYVRGYIVEKLGKSMGQGLVLATAIRNKLMEEGVRKGLKDRYMSIVNTGFFRMIENREREELDSLLVETFGVDYTLEKLEVTLGNTGYQENA